MKRLLLFVAAAFVATTISAQTPPENSDDRVYLPQTESGVRRIVSIPDIDGYLTLKGDFHMHTVFADATVSPVGRVREAWRDGLDVIAMTEHIAVHKSEGIKLVDYNLPNQQAIKEGKKWGLLVIPGAEITRTKPFGHMNALFLKDCNVFEETRYLVDENGKLLRDENGKRIPNRATEMKDFEAAEKQGAFIIWNHPGWPDKKCTLYDLHKGLIEQKRIHAVEIFNSHEWYPKVLDWFDTYGLPMMANTDIHNPSGFEYGRIVRPMTLVFAKERTIESVREAMFAGRMLALFTNKLAGREDLIKQVIDKSLQVRVINKKKGVLEVTNISDITFRVLYGNRMNPVVFYPRSAVRVTVPKGTKVEFIDCMAGRNTVKTEIW